MKWATSLPVLVFQGLSILDLGPMYATDRRQTRIICILHSPSGFPLLIALSLSTRCVCVCVCVCRDFAYVSADSARGSYTCHVFRSDSPADQISDVLHDVTKNALSSNQSSELSERQSSVVDKSQRRPLLTGDCQVTACSNDGAAAAAAVRPNSLPNLVNTAPSNCCHDAAGLSSNVVYCTSPNS